MRTPDWHVERRFGVKIGRDGLSFFSSKAGHGRPQANVIVQGRQRRSWAMWTLPLIATAGVATAVPTVKLPDAAPGQVWMPLDAATPTAHLAPIETFPRARPTQPINRLPAPAARVSRVTIPKSFFEEAAPQEQGLSQRAALAQALSTGHVTDWNDAPSGQGGLVVVGEADDRGCRDVVVMTRRPDGRNDNAARRECGKPPSSN
jgi:hypothetical protein